MNSQMMNREMLSEEHAELDALAVRVLALVGGPREQAGELSAVRWRLSMLSLASPPSGNS